MRASPTASPNSADIWRDQNSESHLNTNAFYVQDTFTQEPPHAEPRLPLRHAGRRAAGGGVPAEPVLPDADAGDRLPGRRCRRGVEGLLAARRRDLRPHRRRPQRRVGVVRHLLRPDVARPALEPARRHRRGVRSLSLGRHQRRRLRAAGEVNTIGAVPEQEHGVRPGEPGQHDVADPRRSGRQERPHARVHRRLRSPAEFADGGRRQLRLAQVRSLPLERSRQLHQRRLPRGAVHADDLPVRARAASRSPTTSRPCSCLRRTLYTNRPDRLPRLQRLRTDVPEAHGQPLVGERQLRLQQRGRALRIGSGV